MIARPLLSTVLLSLLLACSGEAPPTTAPVGATPAEAVAEMAEGAAELTGDCELVMGWDPYEPYQFADLDGNVRGLDIELVQEMASQAGCSLSFSQKDWAGLLADLRDGKVSILAGASRIAERESYALFSKPYRKESFALYVRAGEADNWQAETLAELVAPPVNMRIGITDGYLYGVDVDKLLDDANLGKKFTSAPFSEAHAANLMEKRIDGMLEDPFVATAMIRRKALSDFIIRTGMQIDTGEVALMFSKASVSSDTVAAFDAALEAMRKDGRYDAIIKRYSVSR